MVDWFTRLYVCAQYLSLEIFIKANIDYNIIVTEQ